MSLLASPRDVDCSAVHRWCPTIDCSGSEWRHSIRRSANAWPGRAGSLPDRCLGTVSSPGNRSHHRAGRDRRNVPAL